METAKTLAFGENMMATTVGAGSLNVEATVSQPNHDLAELMVDGLDYVFDQAKFEEYLSSSSSRSSPSRKHQRISSPRRNDRFVAKGDESHPSVTEVSSRRNTPANCKAGSSAHTDSIPMKESSHKISATLSKRARQRQHQRMARQFAKAMESPDGVHYYANFRTQRHQETTPPQSQVQASDTPIKEEWLPVKKTRLTRKEHVQRRRARATHTREIISKAQKSKSAKGSNHKVWIPKSAQNPPQDPAFTRDSPNCLGQTAFTRDSPNYLGQSALTRNSSNCRAQRPFTRDTSNCLGQRKAIPDTSNCPGQASPPQLRPSTSPADASTTKLEKSTSVFNRLGPLPGNQGKALVHERLGHARQQTGSRAQNPVAVQKRPEQAETPQTSKLPTASRLSIPQGVRETAEGKNSKCASVRKVTREDNTIFDK